MSNWNEHGAIIQTDLNIGSAERNLSLVSGGALTALGLAELIHGKSSGAMLMLTGGVLAVRGVTGRSMLYQLLGINRAGFDLSNQVSKGTFLRPNNVESQVNQAVLSDH